jgi:ABC-type transport system involved in multi-copper enzyme maturation permease subunit
MTAALPSLVSILSTVRRLPGPIFNKELRVASRQRRSYVLRFAYVGVLTIFVAGTWFAYIGDGRGSGLYQTSRLATVGQMTVVALIWFQFIAAQLAALLLFSDALSSEVRKRTLPILAVTPLGGMQIVGGKLAAGLLPIVMLLAVSLPLLALVRVFGGVPWDYIVSGVSITFSAVVFAGALHLLASLFRGRALALLAPVLWFCLLGRVPDLLIVWLAGSRPGVGTMRGPILLSEVNPTDVLLLQTKEMLAARPSPGSSFWWPLHCLVLLIGSALILWLTGRRVGTVATRLAPDSAPGSKSPAHTGVGANKAATARRPRARVTGPIQRVTDSPVLWKELRSFAVLRDRHPLARYGVPALLVCLVVGTVIGIGVLGVGGSASALAGSMVPCAFGLHVGAAVAFSGAAATMIPKEREAGTLPVLLATPLEDDQIVKDKAIAVLRQSVPVLAPLSVFLLFSLACMLASTAKPVRPLPLVCTAGFYLGSYFVCLLGILPLLAGLGLYCGARLKTTVAARGCTFTVVLLGVAAFCFITVVLLYSVVPGSAQVWLVGAAIVVGTALVCARVGLILLRAAARRLRCNIF